MWKYTTDTWVIHDPSFAADRLDPQRRAGPWAGHRWFVYDLLRNGRPEVVVELGTHYGVSLFAMCQAVLDGGGLTRVHAVDTWEGDEHAGRYGEEVWDTFNAVLAAAYEGVDTVLHRMRFEDAVAGFDDGSIDVLHIDGFHSYDAAKADYETWIDKVAEGGVVLFHDVDERTGYGSADYWEEIRAGLPHLTFRHSFGLGVLFPKGTDPHGPLLAERPDLLIEYYRHRAGHDLRSLQVHDLERMVDARDEVIAQQTVLIDDRDAAIAAQTAQIDDRDAAIRSQTVLIDERDLLIRRQGEQIAELSASVQKSRAEVSRLEHKVAEYVELASRPTPPPSIGAAVRPVAGRVVRRQHALARRAAPHLPRPVLLLALRGKRALARNVLWRRLTGRPALAPVASVPPEMLVLFDEDFYVQTYGPPGPGLTPFEHYVHHGWWKGQDPSPLFSVSWYLGEHPDVASSGLEPLTHWLTAGCAAGFDPSPWFSTAWYTTSVPEVASGERNPLVHYWTEGYRQARTVSAAHRAMLLGERPAAGDSRLSVTSVLVREPEAGALPGVDAPLDAVRDLPADLLTVDVWDTLIARDRPADAAKTATARRMMLRLGAAAPTTWELHRLRVEVEAELAAASSSEEYELREVLAAVLARLGVEGVVADSLADELFEAEVADEIAGTYLIAEAASFLRHVLDRPAGPAVRLLSDFYLGAEPLGRVLRAHGVDLDRAPLLVSCETGVSKRLGTAFPFVRGEAGVEGRHLHLGDNPVADGDRAVESGATSLLIRHTDAPFPHPGGLEPAWFADFVESLVGELGELAIAAQRQAGEDLAAQAAFAAGVRTSIFPVAHVAGVIETAARAGVDRVHYLSREGAFLRDVHHLVGGILGGSDVPLALHLEVSRRSTFGPSLRSLQPDELARMWRQYRDQSPNAFLLSLGIDPAPFGPVLREVGLDPAVVVPALGEDGRFRTFLERPDVAAPLMSDIAARRALLLRYLDARGLGVRTPAAVLADVGWRGTIQDNLCALLPETVLHGVYLGLFPFLNPQPINARKSAVVFDGNRGETFGHVDPPAALEAPWTPVVPSTLGYAEDDDGRVVAVTEDEPGRAEHLLRCFADGVRLGAPVAARRMVANGADTALLREGLQRALEGYFRQPEPGVADIWFGSVHDDTFGALNDTPYEKLEPPRSLLWSSVPAEQLEAAAASRWAPGWAAWSPVRSLDVLRRARSER